MAGKKWTPKQVAALDARGFRKFVENQSDNASGRASTRNRHVMERFVGGDIVKRMQGDKKDFSLFFSRRLQCESSPLRPQ